MSRTALVERVTKESDVRVELDLDGTGQASSDTGVPFFDHMVAQLGKHGGFDLAVRTAGDLEVDAHHTVEDTSLALGQALKEALGDKAACGRFGDALVPSTSAWCRRPSTCPAGRTGARGARPGRADRQLRTPR
jgi:imidazoleglycerol-phosphate dehydratase